MNALDRRIAGPMYRPNHKHATDTTSEPICFSAPVAVSPYTEENLSAHGGIEETDSCACGTTRRVLTNGLHVEYGPWSN